MSIYNESLLANVLQLLVSISGSSCSTIILLLLVPLVNNLCSCNILRFLVDLWKFPLLPIYHGSWCRSYKNPFRTVYCGSKYSWSLTSCLSNLRWFLVLIYSNSCSSNVLRLLVRIFSNSWCRSLAVHVRLIYCCVWYRPLTICTQAMSCGTCCRRCLTISTAHDVDL